MKICRLGIQNFKSIKSIDITNLESALIFVGKNSTGKTTILDAVRAIGGNYKIETTDFREEYTNIIINVELEISREDLSRFHKMGIVSNYKNFDAWLQDFKKKLPSYQKNVLSFTYTANWDGTVHYSDGFSKENPYIPAVIPRIYYLDTQRNIQKFHNDLLFWMENDMMKQMRSDSCMFDPGKKCMRCFQCMGMIEKKTVQELNAFEAARLLEYKIYQINLDDFSKKLNQNYRNNGGQEEIIYSMQHNLEELLRVKAESTYPGQNFRQPIHKMAKGMRSVYMLSLLETYAQGKSNNPGIIVVEEPEIYLHPQMQKIASEILYRLSKKNQVIFTTHSPNILYTFNTKQIRQIVLDKEGCSRVKEKTNMSNILNDLGYSASDLMNVDFVFIVEGKQDKSRLPILIHKYYSEIYDKEGHPSRISIITTNSCTNIKTYANLKYINQLYLRDQFLMIRDGDGKNPEELKRQLCSYYAQKRREDADSIARVLPKNVLILKYYSFENYFLNPVYMAQIGVVKSEEQFYEILLRKWKEYLKNTRSGKQLTKILGKELNTIEDLKVHMEEIKIYVRGHNLYDIFYKRFKKKEQELLKKYVEIAPREEFQDILDAIDDFIYFENRVNSKKDEND